MKSTIVPAQITTVEDKIAGNLTLSQLLLLSAPIFGGSILYIVFPPTLHFALYKIVMVALLSLIFGLMAIRVKGTILLLWAVIIVRYNLRPRYHIFDKNHVHMRDRDEEFVEDDFEQEVSKVEQSIVRTLPLLSTAETAQLEQFLSDPRVTLSFKPTKKGGMSVTFTEVNKESIV
jgi:hypothetical protein